MPKPKTAAPMEDRRSPIRRALATALVSEADFLRLQTIARLYARGLTDVSWHDLLNEAIARVLEGKRQASEGVATAAFLAGVGTVASGPAAQAQTMHRHFHPGPGFHPGFHGRFGFVGGPRFYRSWYGWPGYGYYGGPAYVAAPGCYWQRQRFWDGYGWRFRRVRVCG